MEAYLQYLATGTVPSDAKDEQTLEVLDERIANEDQLHRKIVLIAQRHRLANPPPPDAGPLVDKFVQYAATFGERNQITYAVWREMGVPPKVLKQAGIPMTGRTTGAAPPGAKLALDDPRRIRAYAPRRNWTEEEKAEYIAFYEEHGKEATAEKYGGTVGSIAQRYYGFKAKARAAAGQAPHPPGRPKSAGAA